MVCITNHYKVVGKTNHFREATMHAAVIATADAPPVYRDHPDPTERHDDEMVVEVLAAGLHHLTRAKAIGVHYSSNGVYPLVPGVDGVVRDKEGNVRYVVLDDTALGTFADRTLIDPRRSVILPDGVDPVQIAARSDPSPARPRRSPPRHCAPPACGSSAAASARSPPGTSSPSCRSWPRRWPRARSTYGPAPCPSPRSRRRGPPRPTTASSSSPSRHIGGGSHDFVEQQ